MKKLILALLILFIISSCSIWNDIMYSIEYPAGSEWNPTFIVDTVYYSEENVIGLMTEYQEWCEMHPDTFCYSTLNYANNEPDPNYIECEPQQKIPTLQGFLEWYEEIYRK